MADQTKYLKMRARAEHAEALLQEAVMQIAELRARVVSLETEAGLLDRSLRAARPLLWRSGCLTSVGR